MTPFAGLQNTFGSVEIGNCSRFARILLAEPLSNSPGYTLDQSVGIHFSGHGLGEGFWRAAGSARIRLLL